jgi:hypothetical protein
LGKLDGALPQDLQGFIDLPVQLTKFGNLLAAGREFLWSAT